MASACTRAVDAITAEGSIAIPCIIQSERRDTLRVRDIAAMLNSRFEGAGDTVITGAAAIDSAAGGDISFATGRALAQAKDSAASCVLVPLDFENDGGRVIIRVGEPRSAFAAVLRALYPTAPVKPGIHHTAVIADDAFIDSSSEIGPHTTIASGSRIGPNTRVSGGCFIGRGVRIGRDCILQANVSIYEDVQIGDRVVLHSGCVVGADGFGFVLSGDHYEKFPQVGTVVIEDDVEIGANSCIDRAALGVTRIGHGSKLDNMVHVGHNCRVGKHVVIAAQTGLSGGVVIEDYAVVGGQVGIGDKARIESGAVLGSGCGVLTSKIVRAGEPVWGTPARPLRQHLTQLANLARLPQLRNEIAGLKKRLAQLESSR